MTHQPLWVILCRFPEKGRRERRNSRGNEREEQGRKRNRKESEETEEIKIKTFPPSPPLANSVELDRMSYYVASDLGL